MTTLSPFRIHFDAPDVAPLDVDAADPADARVVATKLRPGVVIRKVKIVREEQSHG